MYPETEPSDLEKDQANKIMDIVNNMMLSEKGLVAGLARNHRTLQQNLTRVFVAWIEYLSQLTPGEYDLRNEDSVRLAKYIAAQPEWQDKKYLSHI